MEIARYVIHKSTYYDLLEILVDGGNPKQPPGMVLKSCYSGTN